MKRIIAMVFFMVFIPSFTAFSQTTETLTIATYYPSPHGIYGELKTRRMAVGDAYFGSDYCWPPATCAKQIENEADLIVEGRVGIGTANPGTTLQVDGGILESDNIYRNRLRVRQTASSASGAVTAKGGAELEFWNPDPDNFWAAGGLFIRNWGDDAAKTLKENQLELTLKHQKNDGVFEFVNSIVLYKNGDTSLATIDIDGTGANYPKVGIGTATPQARLDVAGNVKIGAYTLPSTDGTANQTLVTNGSGTVNWASGAGPDAYTLPSISCSGSSCSATATKGGKLKILTGTVSMPNAYVWTTITWSNTPFTTIHNAVATVEKTGSAGTNEVGCRLVAGSNNSISVINDVASGKVHFIVVGE